ncbi:hypothetical protein [Laspinema palackyanum]|uniref:hypothetical protein n=1 Tax=Laspinema palackyanum TaxID=3231601 RepID=UPI00345C812D|nr:hypothetical protein [Laspinema sp. D2c]
MVRRFPYPKIPEFESPLSDRLTLEGLLTIGGIGRSFDALEGLLTIRGDRPAFFWLFTGGGIDGFITIFDDRPAFFWLFTGGGIGGFFSLGGDRFFEICLGALGYSLDEGCLTCLRDGDESSAGESVGFCQLCRLDIPV